MAARYLGLVILALGMVAVFSTAAASQSVVIDDVHSRLSQNVKLEIEEILDEVYLFHSQHLSLRPQIMFRLKAFSSRRKYSSFEESVGIAYSAGVYLPRENLAAVNLENRGYRGTIIHEGQHYIVGSAFKSVPSWINEGFSEYIETASVQGHRVTVARHDRNLRWVRAMRDSGELPSLKHYLSMSERRWRSLDRPPVNAPRALAWSLVYFLMDSEEGKSVFGTLIGKLARNEGRSAELLAALYPGGLEQMEADWNAFLDGTPAEQRFDGSYYPLEEPEDNETAAAAPENTPRMAGAEGDWLVRIWRILIGS